MRDNTISDLNPSPPSSRWYAWTNDEEVAIAYNVRDDTTGRTFVALPLIKAAYTPCRFLGRLWEFEVRLYEPSSEIGQKRPSNVCLRIRQSCSIVLSHHIIYLDATCRSLSPMTRSSVSERGEANFMLPQVYIEACIPAGVGSANQSINARMRLLISLLTIEPYDKATLCHSSNLP